ncbi:oxidoreductase [Arenibacter sp. GZD96]|uniref:WD40/YVTN/BNR-like repeat-containing protein n=1 Tax=Aurantibrevibacter litoralis TaxID=3106030 RepID=UPI002AFFBF47|nr:hypothetical protein [Arenibacter sp. GZD-96]MEA1786937.1 oxidoreductase [Arenibacter sp. GZD-96]
MRYWFFAICGFCFLSCDKKLASHNYTSVGMQVLYTDSISIRAITVMEGNLAFAANKGTYGMVDFALNNIKTNVQLYDGSAPEFRAVAHTATDFFMLSIANPALLYKTGDYGNMELVYQEEDPQVFYDAMHFMNDTDGIAVGDSMNGCLSVILTRDGGATWRKLPCTALPDGVEGEGAFAASNSNIVSVGNIVWMATSKGRVLRSEDKGETWTAVQTPIAHEKNTQGIYAMDFYDAQLGILIGGDYTQPEGKTANKAITVDGGKSWQLIADGMDPGYKSCIQFVPNSGGKDVVAVGFTGISYSNDGGESWKTLSDESFYTLRFLNDSVAYAAGKNRFAKLIFRD